MLLKKVSNYITEHHMISPKDVVCVACSGGADSIALLTILYEFRASGAISCDLMACHLNHQLRGNESDEDAQFVAEYCAKLKIPLISEKAELHVRRSPGIGGGEYSSAKESGNASGEYNSVGASGYVPRARSGLEAAGREAREELYCACLERHGATKIALAHHMDDQAETVLFHLARGAGLTGLSGMWPVRGVKIRPLLCVRRAEIETWLAERGISWRTDRSNASDDYARNRIRHHILPELETGVNQGAVKHLAEAAEQIRLADAWIRYTAEETYSVYVSEIGTILPGDQTSGESVSHNGVKNLLGGNHHKEDGLKTAGTTGHPYTVYVSADLLQESEVLQRAVLIRAYEALTGTRSDLGLLHVRQLQDLLGGTAGRTFQLPNGVRAIREYGQIRMTCDDGTRGSSGYLQIPMHGAFCGEVCGYRFTGEYPELKPARIPEKTYTKWINCDKISGSLAVRTRRPGDYLVLNEQGQRQSLKAWMINHKIPRDERDRILLLVVEPDNSPIRQKRDGEVSADDSKKGAAQGSGETKKYGGSEVLWIVGGRISAAARVQADTKRVLEITAEQV